MESENLTSAIRKNHKNVLRAFVLNHTAKTVNQKTPTILNQHVFCSQRNQKIPLLPLRNMSKMEFLSMIHKSENVQEGVNSSVQITPLQADIW